MKPSKAFIARVIKAGTVDTAKYRYHAKEYADRIEVQRIERIELDTTYAIDGWKTVAVIR